MISETVEKLVAAELAEPQFGLTKQFLAIHRISYVHGQPLIKRVAANSNSQWVGYLAVEQQRFYLAMYINAEAGAITWVETEAFHDVWLRASSDTLPPSAMLTLTNLVPIRQYVKGEPRSWGSGRNPENAVDFQSYKEPDIFENHLSKLLDHLEQDTGGIKALTAKAECIIRVASYFHHGNQMLGGHFIDAQTLKRISSLGLSIDFDLYAEGNN